MLLSHVAVLRPESLADALHLLHSRMGHIRVIAGGTDIIIQLKDGLVATEELLDISCMNELRYVQMQGGYVHVGALTTYSDIAESSLLSLHAPVLVQAAKMVGGWQIQNRGTIGGNLANASPAGDSIPPLYALDATVELRSQSGVREVKIANLFVGPRKTVLRPDELIVETRFKAMDAKESGIYLKLGLRHANAIAVVSVAIWVRRAAQPKTFGDARVALGAVAPTVVRAQRCEKIITSGPMDEERLWEAAEAATEAASPISDIRGSAEYRQRVVASLTYQGLFRLLYGGGGVGGIDAG